MIKSLTVLLGLGGVCYADSGPPRLDGKLSLAQAIDEAVKYSPSLWGPAADIKGAQAGARSAESRAWPRLNFNSFAFTGNDPSIVSSSMGVDPATLMSVPRSDFADQNLTLMVPLFTGGVVANAVRAAKAAAGASSGEAQMAASELELRVRDAYLRALVAREFVKAGELRLQSTQEMERIARVQFEAGQGIEASVMRAEAESADAERALASARNDADKTLIDLKLEMGVDLGSNVDLSDSLSYTEPILDLDRALRSALQHRGDVLAAGQRRRQAEFQRGVADANGTPQIYGVAMSDAWSSRQMGSSSGSTVGLTLSIPIFDAGQRSADRQQASAMVLRARADEAQAELNAQRDVREAWLDVQTAAQNYRSAQSALKAAQGAYEVISLRVQNGKGTLVEQLDGLATLVRARANLAQALYDHEIALARLDRAQGAIPPGFDPAGKGGSK